MQIINLYRYTRPDGGVSVSPVKPEGEYQPMYRLVADEGMALTKDGENLTSCTDVESTEGWYEVEAAEGEATEQDYLDALNTLGVKTDEESNS